MSRIGLDWSFRFPVRTLAARGGGRVQRSLRRAVAETLEARQLLSFGELETFFSGDGKRTTNVGTTDQLAAALLQPDGKVIVAGTSFIGSSADFEIARYNADGSPDTTFNGIGENFFTFGSEDICTDAALQPDGKIVLVGYTNSGATGGNDTAVVRFNADGTRDLSFNGTGGVRIDHNGTDDRGAAVTIVGTSIYVAGTAFIGNLDDFALAKLTGTGALDGSLGGGTGKALYALGNVENGQDVVVQGDGKIIVAGFSNRLGNNNMLVIRTSAAGVLDPTFDTDGIVDIDFTADDRAFGVAIDNQGRIVVVGQWDGGASDFAVARLTTAGALDTGFGGGFFASNTGKTNCTFGPFTFGGEERARSVAILPNDSIMVGGFTDASVSGASTTPGVYNFAAARFTAAGALDTTFDGDGRKTIDFGGSDQAFGMAVARDAGVVLAGGSGGDFAVARLRGSLDIAFDTDGKQTLNFGNTDTINGVVLQTDGKIVVAGSWDGGSSDFAIARYLPSGALDPTFGFGFYGAGSGMSNITFGTGTFGGQEFATDVALQPDGKIVVAGYTNNVSGVAAVGGNDFAITRLNANGTPDLSFNGTGKFTLDIFGTNEQASSVVVLPNGKILVAGMTFIGFAPDFVVIRLNANGTLDGTFGAGGIRNVTFGGTDLCHDMVVQPDGKIVLVGETDINSLTTGIDSAAIRLTAQGNLDPTFGSGGLVRLNYPSNDVANAVTLDPDDGGIYLAGALDIGIAADFMVARLTSAAGAPDTSFDFDGIAVALLGSEDIGTSVVRAFDGSLIVGGYTSFSVPSATNVFAAVRFLANGTFDSTFQPAVDPFVTGQFRHQVGTAVDSRALDAALQPDGRIVLAGTANGDFAVMRLAPRLSISTAEFLVNQAPPTFTTSRIVVTFTEGVSASVSAADFSLVNVTTAAVIAPGLLSVTPIAGTNTVVLRYTGTANGVLPDGNYTLTLLAGTVQDGAGNVNAAAQVLEFFVLAGDANRDRTVDITDLGILATNWQLSPRIFSQGDFDYSGMVDITDLGMLATNWQKNLPAAASALKAPASKRPNRIVEDVLSL